ncbi:hypothetical protein AVEN_107177-1 [Araneus ventricosus]|uniref:Pre-C2HC domain-containing protein n=1 Tax=Araneus ventricosus TaxID=182803 RepID=A0A4Y2FEE1_ARAVE|nr:hypothetical protein AVEN_107177-1 [Araneus ventricosus]
MKVVIRGLPIKMEKEELVQNLEEKGYNIERIAQMKNLKKKKPLSLLLTEVKKSGNYTNIYNEKQVCYYKPEKSYAQAAADKNKKEGKTDEKEIEAETDKVTDLTDLKDSLQALKEVKMLLQEFSTNKQERVIIVIKALLSEYSACCPAPLPSPFATSFTRHATKPRSFSSSSGRGPLTSGIAIRSNSSSFRLLFPFNRLEDGGPLRPCASLKSHHCVVAR